MTQTLQGDPRVRDRSMIELPHPTRWLFDPGRRSDRLASRPPMNVKGSKRRRAPQGPP